MQNSIYLIDNFVSVTAGEPFRLFPFGKIIKNGKAHEITRAIASKFRLPHFKPPIKLGSHEDVTPAGGFIIGLEVRDDGLYAIPEWNDSGVNANETGAYRYHSPEIIWEGGFEHPETGEIIEGPLIVGDALLHTPHLGEATALYSVEPITNKKDGDSMSENTVTVPANFWEKLTARFFEEPKANPEPAPQADPPQVDEFAAQVETLTAQVKALEAEKEELAEQQAKQVKIDAFSAEFKDTSIVDKVDLFSVLAEMDEEDAGVITKELKALAEQAKLAGLDKDIGSSGEEAKTAIEKFNAAIDAKMADGLTRDAAQMALQKEMPELLTAVREEAR